MTSKHKITRTKPMFGNKRSFSIRATRRELRMIDKIGLPEFLRQQGLSMKALTE